jgi:hypothetical protein
MGSQKGLYQSRMISSWAKMGPTDKRIRCYNGVRQFANQLVLNPQSKIPTKLVMRIFAYKLQPTKAERTS